MNSGLTSHQQRGHTETGPRFKVSSERPEKRGIDLATPGLVVQRVIHYTTAAPSAVVTGALRVNYNTFSYFFFTYNLGTLTFHIV